MPALHALHAKRLTGHVDRAEIVPAIGLADHGAAVMLRAGPMPRPDRLQVVADASMCKSLTDIPSCMALHDKLPDFYEEPPLALLANNNTATPAEAGALMQCHQQGIVPQRAAFV